jgi:PBP1b-binding outer membrane lipoprotein LpoB
MKHFFIILAISILFAGCSKEKDQNKQICNLADPINELPWLKEIKNSLTNCSCQISIFQVTYDQQTVFYTAMNDPLCDGVQTYTLYNCEGKVVEVIPSDKIQAFQTKVTDVKNLYRCKNLGTN